LKLRGLRGAGGVARRAEKINTYRFGEGKTAKERKKERKKEKKKGL